MKQIICNTFNQLTTQQLYDVLKLRQDVFIIEQNCIYEDIDRLDMEAAHLLLTDGDYLVACSRIVPAGKKYGEPSIGRIVTSPDRRGEGHGREIVKLSMEYLRNRGENRVRIEAQAHLQTFYAGFGFSPDGEVFDLDGIPHIEMTALL